MGNININNMTQAVSYNGATIAAYYDMLLKFLGQTNIMFNKDTTLENN
jgi:hypothetical protein